MGNLKNDLDRFLKTDGIRILIESGVVRVEPWEPLTEDDIDDLASMNLDNLDTARLEDLQKKAEDLLDELEEEDEEAGPSPDPTPH